MNKTITYRPNQSYFTRDTAPREPVKAVQTEDYDAWGLAFGASTGSATNKLESKYKYNGKELVDDLGIGLYEYGFRWYDAQIAKFVQVDPLEDEYSYKSTYDYAENRPVSGVDLDGLEYYYAADGIFLGKGTVDPKNNSVHLVTAYKYNSETKNNLISGSREIWNNHDDFIKLAGTAIAESSYGNGVLIEKEIKGIANAILNFQRDYSNYASIEKTLSLTGAFASSDGNIQYSNFLNSSSEKRNENEAYRIGISGAINAITNEIDYSNGAYKWDGIDAGLKGRKHAEGAKFLDKSFDIFNLGDKSVPGKTYWQNKKRQNTSIRGSWDYKWNITAGYGDVKGKKTYGTIFFTPSDEFKAANPKIF